MTFVTIIQLVDYVISHFKKGFFGGTGFVQAVSSEILFKFRCIGPIYVTVTVEIWYTGRYK